MKLQTLKNNNLTCFDYINALIEEGYTTVKEAMGVSK